MAITWRFALCLSMLLLLSRSLASSDADHGSTDHGSTDHGSTDHDSTDHSSTDHGSASSSDHANTSSSGHDNADGGHDSGHGGEPITTLPIVSWKWHHVETPYLVALWILVSWTCKISECPLLSLLHTSILAILWLFIFHLEIRSLDLLYETYLAWCLWPLGNRLSFAWSLSHVWKGRKQVPQSAGFTKTRVAINPKPSVKTWLSSF